MKRSMLYPVLVAIAVTTACNAGDKDGGGYQGVEMHEGAGTVIGATGDRYGEAATGTVGTGAEPTVVYGDGRESTDTTLMSDTSAAPQDTLR